VAPAMTLLERTVLAIFGPTASGKSALAEEVARRIPAEILSADSMQAYRGLPILTNQAESAARLTAIWDLGHQASVGEYGELAHTAIDEILAAGRTPIVVGGTGLYLRAALAELEVPPPPRAGTRERLEALYDDLGPEKAHALLAERDPAAAEAVHAHDRRRVVRALELTEMGMTLTPAETRLWTGELRHPTMIFGLEVPRELLAERIEARTRAMFERGVEVEVERALAGSLSSTAGQVIGLREVEDLPRDEAIAAITKRTLQYAAYQKKWMRRIPGLISLSGDRPPEAVAEALLDAATNRITHSGQQEAGPSGVRKGKADPTGHAV
jgi:tRNA dimethylallyltransferase